MLMRVGLLCFEVVLKGTQIFAQAHRCVGPLCWFAVFYGVVVLDAHSGVISGVFEGLV